ncbi:MAG: ABC transporter ATP-binding protein [Planctomycetota bacterium]|nr:ABC transporter ATP-binding protein [Planctomycetota bacterium]
MTQPTSSSGSTPLLSLIDIEKSYDALDGHAPPSVLQGVNLTLEAGQSLAIVGPSGCGKSTLLNIIGALTRPSGGTVTFDGVDLANKSDEQLATFRNTHLGFIFQSHHLLPQCSALENVLIPSLVHHDDDLKRSAPQRAKELLDLVGLGDRTAHKPGQLSGGECQRVAVVRALINQPKLLLADEPTGSLDEDSAAHLGDLLATLNQEQGVTLVTVTHSPALAARMELKLTLRRGRLEPWSEA